MAKDQDKKIVIDRVFPVPPGVSGVSQDESQPVTDSVDSGSGLIDQLADAPEILPPTNSLVSTNAFQAQSTAPTLNTTLRVVEQNVRITDDGRSVVDAVVEIDGIDSQYTVDLRVTKI